VEKMSSKGYDASPNLGDVLDMMEGYAYDLWDAVFELVDNSVDSFNVNKNKLRKKNKDWEINVTLDNTKKLFRITDNAFGMNRAELEKALLLAQPNTGNGAIGKYGMGLKTAASWLGKHWTVRTKQYGSNTEYTATVDILKLKKNKTNVIPITSKPVSNVNTSYTIIDVKKGCRKYGSGTMTKTVRELKIAYQKLLNNKKLKLNWKGTELRYEEPPILVDEQKIKKPDGSTKTIKTKYDYKIKQFEIGGSKVSGRYGIYKPLGNVGISKSQVPHAGLTMFYNNRVILNRSRDKWPEKIFGSGAGDLARQRVFLKLDVQLTPNALKTDFVWSEYTIEKLEKEIIKQTDKDILTVRKIATKYRTGKGTLTNAQKQLSDADIKKRIESSMVGDALVPAAAAAKNKPEELTPEEIAELKKLDKKPLDIKINKGQPNVEIYMGDQHKKESFLTIVTKQKKIECFINPNHPFYKNKIGNDPELYQLYMDVCTSIALSKYTADRAETEVSPESFLSVLDIYLRNNGKATE
jgi:hypothetical protein